MSLAPNGCVRLTARFWPRRGTSIPNPGTLTDDANGSKRRRSLKLYRAVSLEPSPKPWSRRTSKRSTLSRRVGEET